MLIYKFKTKKSFKNISDSFKTLSVLRFLNLNNIGYHVH